MYKSKRNDREQHFEEWLEDKTVRENQHKKADNGRKRPIDDGTTSQFKRISNAVFPLMWLWRQISMTKMGAKVNRKSHRKNEFYFCNWADVESPEWEKAKHPHKDGY